VIAVAAIVEGAGEVAALPILLRRINAWRTPDVHLQALPPIRVHRDRFLNRDDEFRRHLLLAAAKCGEKAGFSCCSTPMMTVRLSWGNRFSSEQLHTFRTVGCRSCSPTGNTRPGSSPRLNRSMANAVSHSSLLKRLMLKVRATPRGGSRRTCAAAVTGKRPTSRLFRRAWTCSRRSPAADLFASFAASGQGRWPLHEQGCGRRAMSRRREIARRLDALSDIGGILSAMKGLALMETRILSGSLEATRTTVVWNCGTSRTARQATSSAGIPWPDSAGCRAVARRGLRSSARRAVGVAPAPPEESPAARRQER
jgi:hypothetical protein